MKFVLALLGITLAVNANAAGLGEKIDKVGGWDIYLSTDSMTDKKKCLAVYAEDRKAQYQPDGFAIGNISWPTSYRYRLDDKPASPTKLTEDAEKKVGAVVFLNEKFISELRQSKRLRMQISGNKDYEIDINTSDLPEVDKYLRSSRCN